VETQFLLGDWLHASVLLYDAVEQPEFVDAPEYPQALAYLGDSLRQQGACPAALPQYQALLDRGAGPTRPAALAGALDCRIKLRRFEGLDGLLEQARVAIPAGGPPELAYLVAKALYHRPDLRPSDRLERASQAFAAVAPPYALAAAYFQGVLQIEAGDLARAVGHFERCAGPPAKDARQVEIRELCQLALGRLHAGQEKWAESLDRYQGIPRESPHFNEALFEIAWNYVKARRYDEALRTASLILDLAPESQLAPEAAILIGHLDLHLGRYQEANQAFRRIISTYQPVREEIDAVLTMHEDPIRYFNDLISRQGKAFDVASVLPAMAVKWASAQQDVAGALELVGSLEEGRRDVQQAGQVADRLEALLTRAGGLDASPLLRSGWSSADAIETAVVRLGGQLTDGSVADAGGALPPPSRAELDRVHAERQALQQRLEAMPRSPGELQARQERMSRRIDVVERSIFQLGYQVEASAAAIAGTEAWLRQHRSEILSDEAGRDELAHELTVHHEVVQGYQAELRALQGEVGPLRDAASSVEATAGEAALRRQYHALTVQERTLLARARPALGAGAAADLDRAEALQERLDRIAQRALDLKERFAGEARRRAEGLRARLAVQQAALGEERVALGGVGAEAQDAIGRIAYQSFSAVRTQFYRLVLKADVGLIDVAWSRKRDRVEKIQQLSQSKATELQDLDRDYRPVLKEVD
jgi:tetratricopeptide (TPR) repeat protein